LLFGLKLLNSTWSFGLPRGIDMLNKSTQLQLHVALHTYTWS